MSSLWTPSGEHFPEKEDGAAPPASPPPGGSAPPDEPPEAEPMSAEAQAEIDAMRQQLANSPAEVVVANHCYGLFELAAVYLSQTPPMLFQARLAIDGLGALLDGLKGRLEEPDPSLLDVLPKLGVVLVHLGGVEGAAEEGAP